MSIIYSVVARGPTVLAEYATTSGNFTTVTRKILEKIPTSNSKVSYEYDRYKFHCLVDDSLVYLCLADDSLKQRLAFDFLEDIKNRFKATYSDRGKTALAYGMNEDFSRVLQKQMKYFPSADKLTKVKDEIDEVKSVMNQNIDQVIARGEKIQLLVDKTDQMEQQAFKFKKSSTELKNVMWWKNMKLMIIIFLIVVAVLYFIIAMACQTPDLSKC